jgi:hypothetical protein
LAAPAPRGGNPVVWRGFPKRLSGKKALFAALLGNRSVSLRLKQPPVRFQTATGTAKTDRFGTLSNRRYQKAPFSSFPRLFII